MPKFPEPLCVCRNCLGKDTMEIEQQRYFCNDCGDVDTRLYLDDPEYGDYRVVALAVKGNEVYEERLSRELKKKYGKI